MALKVVILISPNNSFSCHWTPWKPRRERAGRARLFLLDGKLYGLKIPPFYSLLQLVVPILNDKVVE